MGLCIVDSGMKWREEANMETVFKATNHDCSLKRRLMDGTIHVCEGLDW